MLLVDDNSDHLTIFHDGLERYGFSIKAYVNPLKALEEFHPGLYNVAIVDVMMQAMNGIDLSKNLTHVDKAIKILFLTAANVSDKELNRVISNQYWIIRKPTTIKNLVEDIISILALEQNIPLML